MGTLSYIEWHILILFITSILYGVYLLTFSGCLYILISRGRWRCGLNMPLLIAIVILFALTTAGTFAIFFSIIYTLHLRANNPYPGETESAMQELDALNLLTCILNGLYTTNNLVADGLLIWRCYVMWGRRLPVTVIPTILLTVGSVAGYISVDIDIKLYLMTLRVPSSSTSESSNAQVWERLESFRGHVATVNFAMSFVTNILMTGMIAYRFWWTTRGLKKYFGSRYERIYLRIVFLVIESGAIYSACLLLAVIFGFVSVEWGRITNYAIAVQICGLVPTLIIVLVGLGKSTDLTTATTSAMLSAAPDLSSPTDFRLRDVHADRAGEGLGPGREEYNLDELPVIDIAKDGLIETVDV